MSDIVIVAIISGLPATIAAIAAAYTSIRNGKILHKQNEKLEEITNGVNGQTQLLLKTVGDAREEEGRVKGVASMKKKLEE